MTDKKTIQEALAEVQRKANEERMKQTIEMYKSLEEAMPEVTVGGKKMSTKAQPTRNKIDQYNVDAGRRNPIPSAGNQNLPGPPPKMPKTDNVTNIKDAPKVTTPSTPAPTTPKTTTTAKPTLATSSSPSTLGKVTGAAGKVLNKIAPPLQFGLDYAERKGAGQSTAKALGGGAASTAGMMGGAALGSALGPIGSIAGGIAGAMGAGKAYDWAADKLSGSKPAETPKQTDAQKQEQPKPEETPKQETPPAGSSAAKMSFKQAFVAARKAASEKGVKSTGQFEYQGKKYQTNLAPAKGAEKYVAQSKQTKVDIPAAASTKHTLPDMHIGAPKQPEATKTPETPKPETTSTAPKAPEALGKTVGSLMRGDLGRAGEGAKEWGSAVSTSTGRAWNNAADTLDPKGAKPESESGNLKKGKTKMSEETNPLIAAFLKLQSENTSNMFEAAKKLSPKQDKMLDVVDDDKIDAKDFAALRAGKKGKMEEGNIDPVVTGSSSVTKSKTGYVDPSTPTQPYTKAPVSTAAGDVLDKAKNALDKTGVKEEAEEEVTFSQAEIDHINSFFLEASVAPTRPEVAREADSTSDKMSQNDVTGTAESGGKKKIRVVDEAKKTRTEDGLKGGVEFDTSYQTSKDSDETPDVSSIKSKIPPEASWTMTDKPGGIITRSRGETPTAIITRSRGETPRAIITKEETDAADETNMAKTQLKAMASKAKNLHSKLKTSKNLPAWVQSKLAVAKDGVTSVDDYMTHKEEVELEEHKSMEGETLKPGDQVGYKEGHEKYGHIHSISPEGHAKIKVWNDNTGEYHHVTKHVSKLWKEGTNEEAILEGRPKKNPTPETTERDPRQHIQVIAGRAAAGNTLDLPHNDGSKSKITPAMGRKITSHLNGLKPAERQAAVNKMHASAEGLKV